MRSSNLTKTIEQTSADEIIQTGNILLDNYIDSVKKRKGTLKSLLNFCKGQRLKLFVSLIICMLQLSATLYIPVATANIIDTLAQNTPDSVRIIIINIIVCALLLMINFPLQRLYLSMRNDALRSIEAALRSAIVLKVQKLTIQFNKEMASGRIQSKIVRDTESVRSLLLNLHTTATHIIVNIGVILVMLLVKFDIPMLLLFLFCGPIVAIIIMKAKKPLKTSATNYRKAMEETMSSVGDMVELIPVIKAHALEEKQSRRMNFQIASTAKKGYYNDKVINNFTIVNWITMRILQMVCLILSIFLAFNGIMTIGDITLYQNYFGTFVSYISSIVDLLPIITTGFEAVGSIGEILDSDDVEDDINKIQIKDLKGDYTFKNVCFNYRDSNRLVLNNLNLQVKAGETVALVGESGSGKSTIINLVTAFDFAGEGNVLVDGIDIRCLNLKSYRSQIAVVLQNSILFNGTIRDNITFGLHGVTEEKMREIIELSALTNVIEQLPNGLDTVVGEHGSKLSGGQRQRISIARALIRDPKVIIFDEATSALDTVSEKHIQTAIENLSKDKTTFIVAHRLSTIKNADKIAVIKNGRCVEFGTYDELIEKKGEFYNFKELQV